MLVVPLAIASEMSEMRSNAVPIIHTTHVREQTTMQAEGTMTERGSRFKPLRIWIPLLLLPAMLLMRFVPGWVENGPSMIWMASAFGPFLVGLLVLLWWVAFSRANWSERGIGIIGIVAVVVIIQVLADQSMRGPILIVMTIPLCIAGFAIGLCLLGQRLTAVRTYAALGVALVAASPSALLKTDGVWGNFAFGFDWRWNKTPEEMLLAAREASPTMERAAAIPLEELQNPAWPAFRGALQDGAARGCAIAADWSSIPPRELWRIPIGPAWSSFVVAGNFLFTQEQRGELESVVCYEADTGKQVWESSIESRFFEALGGLGPRGTPAIAGGAVYALGAEGWLRKIDATNGEEVWRVNMAEAAGRASPPMWGFSASPVVVDDVVIVHVGGQDDKGILAFDLNSHQLRWSAPAGQDSYGSVQLITLLEKKYLALLSDKGGHFYDPADGKVVLDYVWPHKGYRSLQPQVIDGDKVLMATGMGTGTRLIQIEEQAEQQAEQQAEEQAEQQLMAKELWTSRDMKSDFNDLVVHAGYAYGFDNMIFACIDLQTGKRKWKGGRYGKGQALLLADSGLIIVASEQGELVLLKANPEKHEELYKQPALSGKTWNHPIVVGDRLYLRNSAEAVCYQLPVGDGY